VAVIISRLNVLMRGTLTYSPLQSAVRCVCPIQMRPLPVPEYLYVAVRTSADWRSYNRPYLVMAQPTAVDRTIASAKTDSRMRRMSPPLLAAAASLGVAAIVCRIPSAFQGHDTISRWCREIRAA
jgi:hypothetical protein